MWFEERGVEMKVEVREYGHIQSFYVPVKKKIYTDEQKFVPLFCGPPLGHAQRSGVCAVDQVLPTACMY